jgi:hypothetical protein
MVFWAVDREAAILPPPKELLQPASRGPEHGAHPLADGVPSLVVLLGLCQMLALKRNELLSWISGSRPDHIVATSGLRFPGGPLIKTMRELELARSRARWY